jgi:hypothetical protein
MGVVWARRPAYDDATARGTGSGLGILGRVSRCALASHPKGQPVSHLTGVGPSVGRVVGGWVGACGRTSSRSGAQGPHRMMTMMMTTVAAARRQALRGPQGGRSGACAHLGGCRGRGRGGSRGGLSGEGHVSTGRYLGRLCDGRLGSARGGVHRLAVGSSTGDAYRWERALGRERTREGRPVGAREGGCGDMRGRGVRDEPAWSKGNLTDDHCAGRDVGHT